MGRGLEQLGGTVADHDLLGLHVVAGGQPASQPGGQAVGVAVDPPPGRVDRGVHDLRVRKVGPLGPRGVEHRHALEGDGVLAAAALAQLAVDLLLADRLEL